MTSDARIRLLRLAGLLSARNLIDSQIAHLIRRPALPGHIGEFVASVVFDIELPTSATQSGHDGRRLTRDVPRSIRLATARAARGPFIAMTS